MNTHKCSQEEDKELKHKVVGNGFLMYLEALDQL